MNNEFLNEFLETINKAKELFETINDELASFKENGWSIKEIIGHLIDSASNNHQRFSRCSFNKIVEFPDYQQNEFVNVNFYDSESWEIIKNLFLNFNYHLLHIIRNLDDAQLNNIWIKPSKDRIPLENLIIDYLKHLKHHIRAVQELRDYLLLNNL